MINPVYLTYLGITSGLYTAGLPYALLYSRLSGRYRRSIYQRMGISPQPVAALTGRTPRIWLHAVSMGEVTAATPVIEALQSAMPNAGIVLSVSTEHGYDLACARLPSDIVCIYAPVDFILSVRNAFRNIQPDIMVFVETELWPNWLMTARRMGVRTAVINGRISERAFRRYSRIRPLMKPVLNAIDAFSMIQDTDAQRILAIGADADRISVNGNAKYDLLIRHTDSRIAPAMQRLFALNDDSPVFLAGSTRQSEEDIILDVYQKISPYLPGMLLIIAPRHTERCNAIQRRIAARGLKYQLRTELEGTPRTAPIVILNTMGELQAAYSIATVVFCGGSLVPLGGQNILEPAAWGKPVLYGPSMADFMDAKNILEASGGGIEVENGDDLAEKVRFFLTRPDHTRLIGNRARKAVEMNQGAARKHADIICSVLAMGKTHISRH